MSFAAGKPLFGRSGLSCEFLDAVLGRDYAFRAVADFFCPDCGAFRILGGRPLSISPTPTSIPPAALPPDGNTEFAARLRQAREGELPVRGELLQRCRGYLLTVALRRLPVVLRAKVGASDLAQETLAQAHANFGRFLGTSETELLAWLARILEFNLQTAHRRYCTTDKRDVAREISWDDWHDSNVARPEIACGSPRPESRAIAREDEARLAMALARLLPADREIIELRNLQVLSFVEIAQRLGRTPDAVRKHWARAVDRLSRELVS